MRNCLSSGMSVAGRGPCRTSTASARPASSWTAWISATRSSHGSRCGFPRRPAAVAASRHPPCCRPSTATASRRRSDSRSSTLVHSVGGESQRSSRNAAVLLLESLAIFEKPFELERRKERPRGTAERSRVPIRRLAAPSYSSDRVRALRLRRAGARCAQGHRPRNPVVMPSPFATSRAASDGCKDSRSNDDVPVLVGQRASRIFCLLYEGGRGCLSALAS